MKDFDRACACQIGWVADDMFDGGKSVGLCSVVVEG